MKNFQRKYLLILLVITFLATTINPVFASGEEHRFYITASNPDYGTKWFYFRASNSFSVSYDTGETFVYNLYNKGWKEPVDNIFPPEIGNGSMTYIKCQLVNYSTNNVVDETTITGNYMAIWPSDWIVYYFNRSASYSESLTGSNMGGYFVRDKIYASPPWDWVIIYNGYSDPTYSL
ncbi:MAG: hypothetical protein VR72_14930 [Clostridiaceae bacterium BRH_c20a]|nr:MAG: hypothetical protein VR72_14930 [Clostridiaceae bacterium BRH_c20a]